MSRLSLAAKEAIVKNVLINPDKSLAKMAAENNVPCSSLHKWVSRYKTNNSLQLVNKIHKNHAPSQAEKMQHLLNTAALDEQALSVYCRERGIYSVQLAEWKKHMTTEHDDKKYQALLSENKSLRAELKALQKDLNRKDRALAETTALLVLKKKARAIWGDQEDA